MEYIFDELQLTFEADDNRPTVYVKQFDSNSRGLHIDVTKINDQNQIVHYPYAENEIVLFRMKKPDNHSVVLLTSKTVDSKVEVVFTADSLSVAGTALADIWSIDSTTRKTISTTSFDVIIEPSPNIHNNFESSDEYQIFSESVLNAQSALLLSKEWAVGIDSTGAALNTVANPATSSTAAGNNNARYWALQAAASASNIEVILNNTVNSAVNSKFDIAASTIIQEASYWAIGSYNNIAAASDHAAFENNAKWWAEAAKSYSLDAQSYSSAVESYNMTAESYSSAAIEAATSVNNYYNQINTWYNAISSAHSSIDSWISDASNVATTIASYVTSVSSTALAVASNAYNAKNSAQQAETKASQVEQWRTEAKAWAIGPLNSDAQQYNNNAKYYAEQAAIVVGSAHSVAVESATALAQAWAIGTTGLSIVPSNNNNSKYWAEQAQAWTTGKIENTIIIERSTDNAKYWSTQAKQWAEGTLDSSSDQYQNNAQYWAEQAKLWAVGTEGNYSNITTDSYGNTARIEPTWYNALSMANAATSKVETLIAQGSAILASQISLARESVIIDASNAAKAWVVGTSDTTSTASDTNNAKYWSDQTKNMINSLQFDYNINTGELVLITTIPDDIEQEG